MIGIYINNQRLDTFEDETIKYNAKVNDTENIEKVFSDFSNSFTVPATPNNNAIFKNWFELGVVNNYNSNKRQKGHIEINTVPFKSGVWDLEAVSYKDNRPIHYKITFYSELLNLSDKFGDLKLKDLDYLDNLSYHYTKENFSKLITRPFAFNVDKISMPLFVIGDDNLSYNSGNQTDISSTREIKDSELRPGIKESFILEGIEDKIDVKFNSDLLELPAFSKSYLWLNENDDIGDGLSWETYRFTSPLTGTNPENFVTKEENGDIIKVVRDMGYSFHNPPANINQNTTWGWYLDFNMDITNTSTEYKVRITDEETGEIIYEDNEFVLASSRNVSTTTKFIYRPLPNGEVVTNRFRTEILSKDDTVFDINLNVVSKYGFLFFNKTLSNVYSQNNSNSMLSKFVITKNVPDIKVSDYFKDIMKRYKLLIIPNSPNDFDLVTINDFYDSGNKLDLTKNIDISEHEAKNQKGYKRIEFKHEESDLVLQQQFRKSTGRDYGDLTVNNDSDGKEEEIESIFSNLMLTSLNNTDDLVDDKVIVGLVQTLETGEIKAKNDGYFTYFYNGISSIEPPVLFNYGGQTISHNNIPLVGTSNSRNINQVTQTTNWGLETDIVHGVAVDKSYYSNYWKRWVEHNLDKDNRTVDFKGILTYNQIKDLNLNTEIIVGNNIYNIAEYSLNLNDYKINMKLFPSMKKEYGLFEQSVTPSVIQGDYSTNEEQINIDLSGKWEIEKVDTGDGVNWVNIDGNYQGTGVKKIPVKTTGSYTLAADRTMDILVKDLDNNVTYTITVIQTMNPYIS